jgi:hypothetical protein
MNSLGLSGTSASSCSDKGRDSIFCRFHTIVLPVVMDLAYLLPYTVQMLGICYCGVLPSYILYTKRLLICPCSYSGSIEMLDSSNPPSIPRSLGLSVGTGSLPVARLPAEPLPTYEIFVVVKGILSAGVVS